MYIMSYVHESGQIESNGDARRQYDVSKPMSDRIRPLPSNENKAIL
jgi:hypothetical protein